MKHAILRFGLLVVLALGLAGCVTEDDARDLAVMKPVTPAHPENASLAKGAVFYLTDRTFNADRNASSTIFSPTWSNSLACGLEDVTIPVAEPPGHGEGPWRTIASASWPVSPTLLPSGVPLNHMPMTDSGLAYGPLPCDDGVSPAKAMAAAVAVRAAELNCDHVLVFVHGFNNAFEDALTTAAQLAHDSDWTCPVVTFDWTSAGAMAQYVDDIEHSSFGQLRLAEFLGALSDLHSLRLDIVAHSMGCRLTSATLSALERRGRPAPAGFIDQLVFAAPDVGLGDFELLEPDAAKLASHVTVYASTGDVAVEASYVVHDYQHRAGNNPKELRAWREQSKATLDVIDASETNGDVYGHGYLTRSQMASVDIARVLHGETIDRRLVSEVPRWPASILCFDTSNGGKPCGADTVEKSYSLVPDPGGESWWSWLAKRLWK
jgi:esterase/lipase superfamily enzyme